jgi:hypothetical protein
MIVARYRLAVRASRASNEMSEQFGIEVGWIPLQVSFEQLEV